jgi:hypothetical protein
VQSRGCTAEVQLLSDREERLRLVHLHVHRVRPSPLPVVRATALRSSVR